MISWLKKLLRSKKSEVKEATEESKNKMPNILVEVVPTKMEGAITIDMDFRFNIHETKDGIKVNVERIVMSSPEQSGRYFLGAATSEIKNNLTTALASAVSTHVVRYNPNIQSIDYDDIIAALMVNKGGMPN